VRSTNSLEGYIFHGEGRETEKGEREKEREGEREKGPRKERERKTDVVRIESLSAKMFGVSASLPKLKRFDFFFFFFSVFFL
jgi:hypothetical protein